MRLLRSAVVSGARLDSRAEASSSPCGGQPPVDRHSGVFATLPPLLLQVSSVSMGNERLLGQQAVGERRGDCSEVYFQVAA